MYTPASSEFRKSTRIRGSCCSGMSPNTWASSPAASLLAQPAQLTISVSRFCRFRNDIRVTSSSLPSRDELVEPIQLGFRCEIDLECTSLAAPDDSDLRAEGKAHAIFGRAGVDIGTLRLALRLRRRRRRD